MATPSRLLSHFIAASGCRRPPQHYHATPSRRRRHFPHIRTAFIGLFTATVINITALNIAFPHMPSLLFSGLPPGHCLIRQAISRRCCFSLRRLAMFITYRHADTPLLQRARSCLDIESVARARAYGFELISRELARYACSRRFTSAVSRRSMTIRRLRHARFFD